jgi:hypothetical protein
MYVNKVKVGAVSVFPVPAALFPVPVDCGLVSLESYVTARVGQYILYSRYLLKLRGSSVIFTAYFLKGIVF